MRISAFLLLIVMFSLFNSPAHACRFNVRDVGMVDFSSIPYKLYGIVDDSVSKDDIATIRQISYAAMIDSNVETEIVHLKDDVDHRAISFYEEVGKPALPALVFVSPKDQAVHLEWQKPEDEFKNTVWNTMEYVADSPFRSILLKECINSYGVVLHIGGQKMDDNRRVEAICKRAVEKVTNGMQDLPKEVKYPPVYAQLLRKYFDREELFLWSYGIDAKQVDEPMVAIVYGRGRQIGKILKGDEITLENVLSILSVIGLSCECGLDRSWMMGTMFPLVWNDERRSMAMANVGFDTESPMVITEISQIMNKGSVTQKQGDGSRYAAPDPLLGYAEISLEDAHIYEDATLMREAKLEEVVDDRDVIGYTEFQHNSAEPETFVKDDAKEVAANVNPENQNVDEPPVTKKVDYTSGNGATHRLNIQTEAGKEDEQLKQLAMGITGKTETGSNVSQQESSTTHNQPVYNFTAEPQSNITMIMFTVFGILGGVAILSGVFVLLLARGRQV